MDFTGYNPKISFISRMPENTSPNNFKELFKNYWNPLSKNFQGEAKENYEIFIKFLDKSDFYNFDSLNEDQIKEIKWNAPYRNIMHDITILTDYGFLSNPSRELNFNFLSKGFINNVIKKFNDKHAYFFKNNLKFEGDVFIRHHCLSRDFSEANKNYLLQKRYDSVMLVLDKIKNNS